MANVTITQLPQAGAITGSELVPIVQNGVTVQTTTGAIAASPSQTQTFLTLNQEPTLPNSRRLSGGAGVGLTDGGAQSTLQIVLNGASGSLESIGNGMVAKTNSSTVAARTLTASGAGLSITNGDGVSGNPTFALSGVAAAVANLGGTGIMAIQNGTTVGGVQILGTANQIAVANGNGTGNPTVSIVDNAVLPGVEAVVLPSGNTSERAASPSNGMLRYNTQTGTFEGYANNAWGSITTGSGVTSIETGNGLQGGPITSTGTISIDTNVVATLSDTQTLTNKTISGSSNTLSNIGNSSLTNSAVTINGSSVSLGGSTTVTATATNALTIGTGLSGTSYNGSSAVTISITNLGSANGVATLDGSGTVPVSQLPAAVLGGVSYQGTWNASTNTPTLTSSTGTKGYYYVVDVAGSTNLNGITDWKVGDWAIFNGSVWQKIDNTDAVTSVNGYTGTVVLSYSDVGAPSTSGTNATGTWAIDISGNASTATSATSATNTAITTNSTDANYYLTFVSTTTGNLPQLVNSSLTLNPSTAQLTSGVSGGAF